MFLQLFHAVLRGVGEVHLLTLIPKERSTLGNLSHFTFSPFLRQWQYFLSQNLCCGCLGKGQGENGKVPRCRDLGSLLEMRNLWMGLPLVGVAWSLAEGRQKPEGGCSQKEEGKPHLFKSYGASLFCQRRKYLSQRQFHLNWFALALYISSTVPHCV